jgi:hypothetical protein
MSQPAVVFPAPPPFRRRAFDWCIDRLAHITDVCAINTSSSNDRGFRKHADLRACCRASQGGDAARITGSRPKKHGTGATAGNC